VIDYLIRQQPKSSQRSLTFKAIDFQGDRGRKSANMASHQGCEILFEMLFRPEETFPSQPLRPEFSDQLTSRHSLRPLRDLRSRRDDS
jgi:hypothetical protein